MCANRVPGPSLARVLLEADLYSARDAVALGLIDVIGEKDDAPREARELATHRATPMRQRSELFAGRSTVPEEEQQRFVREVSRRGVEERAFARSSTRSADLRRRASSKISSRPPRLPDSLWIME